MGGLVGCVGGLCCGVWCCRGFCVFCGVFWLFFVFVFFVVFVVGVMVVLGEGFCGEGLLWCVRGLYRALKVFMVCWGGWLGGCCYVSVVFWLWCVVCVVV